MMNLSDKRKNFRFPAYDDEVGVKLNRKKSRQFLSDIDDGFDFEEKIFNEDTDENVFTLDPVEMIDEPKVFGEDGLPDVEVIQASPKKIIKKDNEVPYRKNKKTETKQKTIKELEKEVKKPSVVHTAEKEYAKQDNEDYKAPQSSFSNKLYDITSQGQAKYNKSKKQDKVSFESSYHLPGENKTKMFKPKHIPASMIDEASIHQRPSSEKDELMEELRKMTQDNLLMMEDEEVLNNKQAVKKETNRLEKTLTGIMQDESNSHFDSNYFD